MIRVKPCEINHEMKERRNLFKDKLRQNVDETVIQGYSRLYKNGVEYLALCRDNKSRINW